MSKGRKKAVQNIYWFSCLYAELHHVFSVFAKKSKKEIKSFRAKKRICGCETCLLAALAP